MNGVIFIPSKANQWLLVLSRVILGLVLSRVILGLVLNRVMLEKMLTNNVKVAINFNFIKYVQIFLHVFFLIYEIIYILMQRPKMFQLVVKIDTGQTATFKKKVVYPAQLIRSTFLIYHGNKHGAMHLTKV